MSGFQPIQAPNVSNFNGQGGLLGFISSALNGYNQAIQSRQQQNAQKDEMSLRKQQLQNETAQSELNTQKFQTELEDKKKTDAKNQYDQITGLFIQNPAYAKDPNLVSRWNDLGNQAGVATPRNADGTPNIDAIKPQWSSLSPTDQIRILQIPPEQRKLLLNQYGGVNKNLYKTSEYITNKDKIGYAKLQISGRREAEYEQATNKGLAIRQELASVNQQLEPAKYQSLMAQTQLATVKAALAPQYLQNTLQRTNMESQRLQLAVQKFKAAPSASGRSGLIQAANSANKAYSEAQLQYETAQKNYQGEIEQGADPSDPSVQQASQVMNDAYNRLQNLSSLAEEASALAQSNLGVNASLTSQNGTPSNIVEPGKKKAPDGVAPGTYMLNGKKVTVDANGYY